LGRRARDLKLPARWSAYTGVYSLQQDGAGGLLVRDNTTLVEHPVAKQDRHVYSNGEPIPIEHLTIKKNWNMKHAAISTAHSCSKEIAIVSLGKFFTGEMPAYQHLALPAARGGVAAQPTASPKPQKMIADSPSAEIPEVVKDPYGWAPAEVHEKDSLPPLPDWLQTTAPGAAGGNCVNEEGFAEVVDDASLADQLSQIIAKEELHE
jgi:hypothetical protein